MIIHNLIQDAYWGGVSQDIAENGIIPAGWTAAALPADIPQGFYARLGPDMAFELTDIPPPAPVEPAPQPTRLDTPLFLMRFTPSERVAMRAAARADTETAPLIDDWLRILNDPRLAYVELGDPNLIAAMTMMVQLGLITQERADQIMAPV